MLTAKEAREQMPSIDTVIAKDRIYVKEQISSASNNGHSYVDVIFTNGTVKDLIASELEELGYKVSHFSNQTLNVKW